MSTLEIVAVIVSLIGVALTVMRNMWCWAFNIVYCLMYAWLFYDWKLYGQSILQFFFIAVNVYGVYYWLKGKHEDDEIRILPLALPKVVTQMLTAAVGGVLFGWALAKIPGAAVPHLDAQLAAFSLLATYWTSRRHIATWVLWVFVNIIYVGMFIDQKLWLTAFLYACFGLMAAYGWWQWSRVKHKQAQSANAIAHEST